MKRHLSESMLLYIHCSNQEIINLTCVPKQSFLVSRHRTLTVSVSNEMLLWSRKKLLTRSSVFKAAKTLLFWPHHCTCHSDLYNDCVRTVQPLGESIKALAKHSVFLLLTSLFIEISKPRLSLRLVSALSMVVFCC